MLAFVGVQLFVVGAECGGVEIYEVIDEVKFDDDVAADFARCSSSQCSRNACNCLNCMSQNSRGREVNDIIYKKKIMR